MNNTSTERSIKDYPYYQVISFLTVYPAIVAIGLIGNALIICIMPRTKVQICRSTKLYYLIIAIADMANLINSWVIWTFLDESLYLLTNGKFNLPLAKSGNIQCKAIYTIWVITEDVSNYTEIALAIERIIAITIPLKSKYFLGMKFSLFLILICTIPPILFTVPLTFLVVGITNAPGLAITNSICEKDASHPLIQEYTILLIIFTYLLHELIGLIVVLVLSYKLIKIARTRLGSTRNLELHSSRPEHLILSREFGSSLVIFILTLINFAVFLPTSLLEWIYFYADVEQFGGLAICILDSICIAHSLNFFVYYFRIPSFKQAISLEGPKLGRFRTLRLSSRISNKYLRSRSSTSNPRIQSNVNLTPHSVNSRCISFADPV